MYIQFIQYAYDQSHKDPSGVCEHLCLYDIMMNEIGKEDGTDKISTSTSICTVLWEPGISCSPHTCLTTDHLANNTPSSTNFLSWCSAFSSNNNITEDEADVVLANIWVTIKCSLANLYKTDCHICSHINWSPNPPTAFPQKFGKSCWPAYNLRK